MLDGFAAQSPTAERAVDRMRTEIDALLELGTVDLDRADRVKDALRHGAHAMRAIADAARSTSLVPWAEAAADAASALDAATPLGLQRAAVQDALRALADAVLVAEQLMTRRGDAGPRARRPGTRARGEADARSR